MDGRSSSSLESLSRNTIPLADTRNTSVAQLHSLHFDDMTIAFLFHISFEHPASSWYFRISVVSVQNLHSFSFTKQSHCTKGELKDISFTRQ